MEGEKYNLARAQDEAEKLRKKVESGEASNYGDAEEIATIEKLKKMIQNDNYFGLADEMTALVNIPIDLDRLKTALEQTVKEAIANQSSASIGTLVKFINRFEILDLNSSEVTELALQGFEKCLSKRSDYVANYYLDLFPSLENYLRNNPMQIGNKLKQAAIDILMGKNDDGGRLIGVDGICKLIRRIGLQAEMAEERDFADALAFCLKRGFRNYSHWVVEKLRLLSETFPSAVSQITQLPDVSKNLGFALGEQILEGKSIDELRLFNPSGSQIADAILTAIERKRFFISQEKNYAKNILNNILSASKSLELPQQVFEQASLIILKNMSVSWLLESIFPNFPIPQYVVDKAVKEKILTLSAKDFFEVSDISKLPVSESVFKDPIIVEKGYHLWNDAIKAGSINYANDIRITFHLSPQIIADPKAQEVIQKEIGSKLSGLRGGELKKLHEFLENYPLPTQAFNQAEILEKGKSDLIYLLSEPKIEFADIINLAEKLHLAREIILQSADVALDQLFNLYLDVKNVETFAKRLNDIFRNFGELRPKLSNLLKEHCVALLATQKAIDLALKIGERVDWFDSIKTKVDHSAAGALNGNLSVYIKYLGDEHLASIFPATLAKAEEMIFAKLTTDQDLADYFVENLDKYYQQPWVAENVAKAIQQYSVAQKFIYAVENDQTTWKNELWVADIFAKAEIIVEEHQKQFQQDDDGQQDEYGYSHGNEGFSESDPFENHPWRFGRQQVRMASALSDVIDGKLTAIRGLEEELKKYGVYSQEIQESLAEVHEKINQAYREFLSSVRLNPNIKDEDKQALLNPESSSVKITSLLNNIRSFIARYFVQSIEGDVARLSEIGNLSSDLDRILAEGFRRYIKIHEVDVPLYDKLYEEFDNLRETGRYPLEVYLGRDGIYAWVGRRTQDVARRRKMGLEERKQLKAMGEVIEIHPLYTVYPRYFRDNLNYETKRQFLEQEGISPDADPLFYDTGYTGTIPEQIMRVMDFSDEDIEQRIRLLSAPSVHRRVKGISENARSEIIEYIEHNAKIEEVAEGLIIDEKTGKIRHIAKPTNPEEQFYFMMVKQAIGRHYWLKEQLHHEPSGNINLDSEHYTIRIRQDYAKLLPPEFLRDPKVFFTQHSELLKGSKGKGKYPDEEVVLFMLSDGTEIVAKRVELRKAKEARKEFSILIAAKKAGLPTAEPVGFLSGKEKDDGNYLLMKKLEGRSGRKFEKELIQSGKYSDEQIKSIMRVVAEKNKEMADLFRTTLKIDKRWRIKDTIIEFNEETGEVESVVPIDWERAQNYNPSTPKEIDEIA